MSIYRHIFFDFDGTIMDTSEGIYNSFDYALKSFGKETPGHEFYKRCIGPPLAVSFKDFFGFKDEQIAECILKYREYYTPEGLYQVQVYNGITECLKELYNKGYKIYLATSKPEVLASTLIQKYDLTKYFTLIGGSDLEETRANKVQVINYVIKECHLEQCKDQILMVGDRFYDVEGANKAGIKTAGVTWGFGNKEELLKSGAIAVVNTPKELLDFIEQ